MATFNSPTDVSTGALARSAHINDLDAAVVEAFGLLPTNVQINTGTVSFAVDTGAADAYEVALPKTAAAYVDGMAITFRPSATNTGASTLNVDSLGAKDIKDVNGNALTAGDIQVGVPLTVIYSTVSGDFHFTPVAAAAASAASAQAAADAIYIDPVWADLLNDGATPPDAVTDLVVSNKKWRYRDFDHAQTEDVHFDLLVPKGYGTIKYKVIGLITNATGPSAEGMAFTLAGYCSGDNDPASQSYGSAVTVTKTGLTAVQNDFFITDWSAALTITDAAELEVANFQFTRDHDHASDDYAQKAGVYAVVIDWDA